MNTLFVYLQRISLHHALEPPHSLGLHFAAVIKRNKVLAVARNYSKSTWRHKGHDKTQRDRYGSQHAERAVVEALGDMSRLRGATIFVWRVGRVHGVLTSDYNSKPCPACDEFLKVCMKKWGLRRYAYTAG